MRQTLGCRHYNQYKQNVTINNNNSNNLIADLARPFGSDERLVSPVKSYGNADKLKDEVLRDNKDQSGIYLTPPGYG